MAAASIQRTLAALAVDCVSVRTDIDCDRRKSLQDSWNGLLHQPGRGTTSEHRGQPAPAGRNRELAFERIRSTGRRSIPRNQTDLSRRDRRSSLQQPGASGAPRGRARPRTGTAPIVGAPPNERYPCGLHRWRGNNLPDRGLDRTNARGPIRPGARNGASPPVQARIQA